MFEKNCLFFVTLGRFLPDVLRYERSCDSYDGMDRIPTTPGTQNFSHNARISLCDSPHSAIFESHSMSDGAVVFVWRLKISYESRKVHAHDRIQTSNRRIQTSKRRVTDKYSQVTDSERQEQTSNRRAQT